MECTSLTLADAGIRFSIVGGNAVRAWVAQVDEAAVRTTRDVDITIRREDLPAAIEAMEAAGFTFRHVKNIDMFLDGPIAKSRDAVHVLFAEERVRSEDPVPTPSLDESKLIAGHPTVDLPALVRMKLI